MIKNTEIIAEIITEEVGKFEKLIAKQAEFNNEFSNTIEKAQTMTIKTDRLEEIIDHWNQLFDKQKNQILAIQGKQLSENRLHRLATYIILFIIILIQIFNIWNHFQF
jgi:hypothetical protein